jgi:hypothetical protein
MAVVFTPRRALGCALLLAVSLATAAVIDGPYALKFKPVKGQSVKNKFTADLDLGVAQVNLDGITTSTIAEVKEDGTWISTSRQTLKVSTGGKVVQSVEDQPGGKVTYAADGQAVSFDTEALGDQPESTQVNAARVGSFIAPKAPVNVGDEWSIDFAANKDKDIPAGTAKFKLVKVEKLNDVDCAYVEASYKQKGDDADLLTSVGKMWINLATGDTVKSVVNVNNLPVVGGYSAKTGTITTEIIK